MIIGSGGRARFASGYLLFVRGGRILAQPFSLRTLKLSGDPQSLGEGRTFSVSANGVLAYNESSPKSEMKILDRGGNAISTPGPMAIYSDPRFSPDGKSIAVTVQDPDRTRRYMALSRGRRDPADNVRTNAYWAAWSPDGERLLTRFGDGRLDGRTAEEILYKDDRYIGANVLDWSPDGKYLSIDLTTKEGTYSNWILPLEGDRKPFRPPAMSRASSSIFDGLFSPDGRWIAYFSYETGRPEVYVVPPITEGAKYHRAVAIAPPECSSASVSLRRSMLPSLYDRELGLWGLAFRGHLCIHFRYSPMTRSPSQGWLC